MENNGFAHPREIIPAPINQGVIEALIGLRDGPMNMRFGKPIKGSNPDTLCSNVVNFRLCSLVSFSGSCSAVATGQCLSATVQMKFGGPHDPVRRTSVQELTDKTQEAFPNDCYKAVTGEGGFRGFPPEIAFEYIKQYGVAVEANHPYCGQRTSTPTPPDSPRIRIQDYTVIRRRSPPGTDSPDFDIRPIIRQQPIVGVLTAYESLGPHKEVKL
ncbi:hypothetical protein RHSIM_Rhsim04G0228900 [Rhododendron simsii]|uniref:Uncharacterized protein n=1 Tax=Rhododendron simsii TaxID=118357 RepID=A0A834LP43_RHOSS|nr:hypothetical protein RHSIM_Rhsim04G0228900 [Rhododendron simsii]